MIHGFCSEKANRQGKKIPSKHLKNLNIFSGIKQGTKDLLGNKQIGLDRPSKILF
ncbi:hypothetical protein THIOSC15_910002 [uncultured Thiomicrorhabdus sp.]